MLVHSECCTYPMSIFPSRNLELTNISLLVCVLLYSLLCPFLFQELWYVMVCGFYTTIENLIHFIHRTPQTTPLLGSLWESLQAFSASFLYLNTCYYCPL